MNKKKNLLISFFTLIFLNGCVQSTAMLGPAFVTNKAVEEETGMNTVTFVSNKIEEQNSKIKTKRDFKKLVRNNFEKTRKKLILEDQSNIFK